MRLALIDLDETLILKDSETLWSRYLTRNDVYDMSRIDEFEREYHLGTMDFQAFAEFQLEPLAALSKEDLLHHRERFLAAEIASLFCEKLRQRVEAHRERGDRLVVVSAAHDFLAAPIAEMAGIEEGLYTIAERSDSGFTGRVEGHPCSRDGKIVRVDQWLEEQGFCWGDLETTWFYSDSHNDLPLLRRVQHAVAVRPDDKLRRIAIDSNWEVIE